MFRKNRYRKWVAFLRDFCAFKTWRLEKENAEDNTEDFITFAVLAPSVCFALFWFFSCFVFLFCFFVDGPFFVCGFASWEKHLPFCWSVNNPIITLAFGYQLAGPRPSWKVRPKLMLSVVWKSIWCVSLEEPNPPIFLFVASLIRVSLHILA